MRQKSIGAAWLVAIVVVATLVTAPRAARADMSTTAAAIGALPTVPDRLVVMPKLTRTAGSIDRWLAGMNRAGMLLGADPVDQLMGAVGFSRHVDRFGALMIAGFGEGDAVRVVVLVPSQDPEGFLDVNFTAGDEPGRYLDARGRPIHARAVAGHVIYSEDASAIGGEPLGIDAGTAEVEAWPAPVRSMLASDDLVAVVKPGPGTETAMAAAEATLADGAFGPAAMIARTLLGPVRRALSADGGLRRDAALLAAGLRFDPLGLVLDAHVAWIDPVASPRESAPPAAPLDGMVAAPRLVSAGWDRRDPVATASLDRFFDGLGGGVRGPAASSDRIRWTVARPEASSPALLGASRMAMSPVSADAAAGRWGAIPGFSLDVARPASGAPRWRLERAAGAVPSPGGVALSLVAFGPRGLGGAVTFDGDGARLGTSAMTAEVSGPPLAEDYGVQLMRQLGGFTGHAESYVDIAVASRWLANRARSLPGGIAIEPIEGDQPPMGMALAGDATSVRAWAVVPAPIAVHLYDAAAGAALAAIARGSGAPAADESDRP